jgi:hypothetical protein
MDQCGTIAHSPPTKFFRIVLKMKADGATAAAEVDFRKFQKAS